MAQWLKDWGDLLIKAVGGTVGLGTLIWTVLKYLQDHTSERDLQRIDLAWRKTEFLVGLAQDIDKDERFNTAMMLIDHDPDAVTALFSADPTTLTKPKREQWHALDRYCDFFDRLYQFVFLNRALDLCDVAAFAGYVQVLCDVPGFTEFADRVGYQDIKRLNKAFADARCEPSPSSDAVLVGDRTPPRPRRIR